LAFDSNLGRLFVPNFRTGRVQVLTRTGDLVRYLDGETEDNSLIAAGIAVDTQGCLVVPRPNASLVHVYDTQGKCTSQFGKLGSALGEFNNPWEAVFDRNGNILVTDVQNHRVQIFKPDGTFITAFGGRKKFQDPRHIDMHPDGRIYVHDEVCIHVLAFAL
jgi:tripartite motif-containing protein 71